MAPSRKVLAAETEEQGLGTLGNGIRLHQIQGKFCPFLTQRELYHGHCRVMQTFGAFCLKSDQTAREIDAAAKTNEYHGKPLPQLNLTAA